MSKPRIYGTCPAGCLWETVHKDDFLRSASIVKQTEQAEGFVLEARRTYKVKKRYDGAYNWGFAFGVTFSYLDNVLNQQTEEFETKEVTRTIDVEVGERSISEYDDYVKIRLCGFYLKSYGDSADKKIVVVVDLNGNIEEIESGYTTDILTDNEITGYGIIQDSPEVFIYNEDATVEARDGNGIASISKTGTSGLVDTYTITYDDGTTSTFTIINGQKGTTILGTFDSESELDNITGENGDAYVVNGDLYVWNDDSTEWVNVGTIKGDKGDTGTVPIVQNTGESETDVMSQKAVTDQLNLLPLPKSPFMDEVNLDELLTAGFYAIDAGCVVTGAPPTLQRNPHYVKVENVINTSFVKQTVGRWDLGNEYFRIINYGTFHDWQTTVHLLDSTNDNTPRDYDIRLNLETEQYVKLGVGDFYVDGFTMPEGTTIEGCGNGTRIITTNVNKALITISNNCTIKNVCLVGLETAQPAQGMNSANNNRIGIYHNGYEENIHISDCLVQGFSDYGIYFESGGLGVNSVLIDNCTMKFCGVGLGFFNTEYACVSNCTIIDNFIGVKSAGGNNKFSNCGIDSNVWGFYIAGDVTDVQNHGHSSCVGCSFNHNETAAIYVIDNPHGFVFSGCCIFDAVISLVGSTTGTLFNGCEFGSGIEFRHRSTGNNYVMNCIFNNYGAINHTITEGSTRAQFINCYNFGTGAVVE